MFLKCVLEKSNWCGEDSLLSLLNLHSKSEFNLTLLKLTAVYFLFI